MQNALEAWHLMGRGNDPHVIGDVEGVDELIDALLVSPPSFSMAQVFSLARERLPSGFPDHEMFVCVNPEHSVGLIAFADGAVGNVVTDSQSSSRGSVAYHLAGNQRLFPRESEISIDLVRRALKEFLSSGGQVPKCVSWKPFDD